MRSAPPNLRLALDTDSADVKNLTTLLAKAAADPGDKEYGV
jgi:hypothetical protein